MAPTIRRLLPEDRELYRDLRLRAMADAPTAFGSTYEREAGLTDQEWAQRLAPEGFPAFVCTVDDVAVGLVGYGPSVDDPSIAYLFSMWVDPAARGTGAADALVAEVLRHSAGQGCTVVRLHVTEGNDRAERLSERHGFGRTGESYVRDRDGMREIEMERR
jgi:ribosomal protein S18 acetylase RimI-like enzyme